MKIVFFRKFTMTIFFPLCADTGLLKCNVKDKSVVKKAQMVASYDFIQPGGLRVYFEKSDRQITAWLAFKNDFFIPLAFL